MAHDTEHTPDRQGASMAAGRLCLVCDKPIVNGGIRIEQFSASGARPDDWRHATCYRRRR